MLTVIVTIMTITGRLCAVLTVIVTITGSYIYSTAQLLHLNEINTRLYGVEYNSIERDEVEFNIVVLCSIKPHIDQVQVW